jgi:O-antigen ligase
MSLGAQAHPRSWKAAELRGSTLFLSALGLEVMSVLFGGASQANALALMTVELASLPLLYLAIRRLIAGPMPQGALWPLVLLSATAAIPLLQLLPLPAALWEKLPGHGPVLEALRLANLGEASQPLSLTPEATWRSFLALAPPAAMFMGALFLTGRQRRLMALVWLALAVASLALGVLQVVAGPDSRLYFYSITNQGAAVGLFANRNHHSAFIYGLAAFAAVFAAELRRGALDRQGLIPLLAAIYFPLAVVGVGVIDSRAGIVLMAPALLGALAVAFRAGGLGRRWVGAALVGGVSLLAIGAVVLFAFGPILDRFDALKSESEVRLDAWPIVLKAAAEVLPFGGGVGSFESLYRSAEPLAQVGPTYFNHAHNEYLEIWLETGWLGAALLAAFLAWLGKSVWRVWSLPARAPDSAMAAAATLAPLLLLAHSVVDYPLRTEAIAVLFAFCCGTITRAESGTPAPSERRGGRH